MTDKLTEREQEVLRNAQLKEIIERITHTASIGREHVEILLLRETWDKIIHSFKEVK